MDTFKNKFQTNELCLYETEFWGWSLRPQQVTLGSGILFLKRPCAKFSELTIAEYKDLDNIINIIEKTLERNFGYDVLNYLMLMMVDKQVHFHIIPRYSKKIEKFNRVWLDKDWPNAPILKGENILFNELKEISRFVKENLQGL